MADEVITFSTQSEILIERLRTRKRNPLKESSLQRYRSYSHNWLDPLIGIRPLKEFGPVAMRNFVSQLALSLAPKTVNEIVCWTKQIVASVTDEQGLPLYLRTWDSEFIDLPVVDARQQKTPSVTAADIERALGSSSELFRCLVACLAGTGLRIGEALAIKLDDSNGPHTVFDSATSAIHVKRGVWRGREQATPKTSSAIRTIEVPFALGAMLKEFAGQRDGFLFGNGRPIPESTARAYLSKHGLPGFHAFRRFRATVLRGSSPACPEDIIRYWLGHSAGSITDHYSKLGLDVQRRREEVERIGLGFALPNEHTSLSENR